MNFPDDLILHPWPFYSHFILLPILVWAILTAPWYKIKKADSQHVFFGAIVALVLVWNVKAGISPGLNFHILGAMVFYLLFGWQFALMGMMLVLLGITIHGSSGWETYSLNFLLMIAIPLWVCHTIFSLVDRKLPNNYFVYVLVNGFLGAALALLSCLVTSIWFLVATETYSYDHIAYEYIPFLPLMLFPEALLSGLMMSIFVAYCPRWVSTFDDERYIKGR